jgi:hypothetical protein
VTTRQDAVGLLGSALLALGAFAISVGHEFVYDDVKVIVDNTTLHSIANWLVIVSEPWWGPELYRPVTSLTLALDWTVSGGHPHWFHAVNVILHVTATGLVFLLARCWLPAFGAVAAGAVFAVHPVHVEAVANVVGRAEVLAGLFSVAAVLAYRWDGLLAARGDTSWHRWLSAFGSLVLLALALGSKESAFATPGLFLVVDWLDAKVSGERFTDRLARHWVLWVAGVALAAEFLWVRSIVLEGLAGVAPAPGLWGESMGGRALVMAPVIVEYVRLLVFPLHLSADYSPDFLVPAHGPTLAGLAGVLLLLVAIVLALRARHAAPVVTLGLAWIGGSLLVVSNVLVPTGVLLAERSMYVPSVGLALLAGWVAVALVARRREVAVGAVALVVTLGMVRTIARVPVWRAAEPFFSHLVTDARGSYRAYWVQSASAYAEGERERGEALALRALQIVQTSPNLWAYLARAYEEEERWLEAAQALRAAFRLDTTRARAAGDGMVAFLRAGALDSAASLGREALEIDPRNHFAMIAMSDVALRRGRALEAMTWRRQVAWRFPQVWEYWYLTAEAALQAGFCPEGARSIARLRALKPELTDLDAMVGQAMEGGCLAVG